MKFIKFCSVKHPAMRIERQFVMQLSVCTYWSDVKIVIRPNAGENANKLDH